MDLNVSTLNQNFVSKCNVTGNMDKAGIVQKAWRGREHKKPDTKRNSHDAWVGLGHFSPLCKPEQELEGVTGSWSCSHILKSHSTDMYNINSVLGWNFTFIKLSFCTNIWGWLVNYKIFRKQCISKDYIHPICTKRRREPFQTGSFEVVYISSCLLNALPHYNNLVVLIGSETKIS